MELMFYTNIIDGDIDTVTTYMVKKRTNLERNMSISHYLIEWWAQKLQSKQLITHLCCCWQKVWCQDVLDGDGVYVYW